MPHSATVIQNRTDKRCVYILGIFSQSVENFDEMLSLNKFDTQDSKYIKGKIMNICIRRSSYIFVNVIRSGTKLVTL